MSINGTNEPASTALDALRKAGIALCTETAEYSKIAEMSPIPTDATFDFPLILEAVSNTEYAHLLQEASAYASTRASTDESLNSKEAIVNLAMNRLLALFGKKILGLIPGRVSLPLDPRLFVDTINLDTTAVASHTSCTSQSSMLPTASDSETYSPEDLACALTRARALLAENDNLDLVRTRVLVQIPATPLGIAVAHALEAAGAHAAMTLVRGVPQAIACVQAGASVVSLTVNDSRLVKRVMSDTTGYGYSKRTEIMACGSDSLDGIVSLIPCEEGSAADTALGAVSLVALTPDIMKVLHGTQFSNPTSTLARDEADDGHFSSIPKEATVAPSLPEYFSRSSGRMTVEYAAALAQDHSTMENFELGLQKHAMCAQMVEELLAAELESVVIAQEVGSEARRENSIEESAVPEGDIIIEGSVDLGLLFKDDISSKDGNCDSLSASTADFEDVDMRTLLTNSALASKSGDAPTQDITDIGDDHSIIGGSPPAELSASVGSGDEPPTPISLDIPKSENVAVPIADRVRPHMSVKARVMEIEARLDKDKQIEGLMAELKGDVSVHA